MARLRQADERVIQGGKEQADIWRFLMDNEAILRQRCRQVIRSPQDALSELRLRLFSLLLREPQRLTGIDNVPAWLRRVAPPAAAPGSGALSSAKPNRGRGRSAQLFSHPVAWLRQDRQVAAFGRGFNRNGSSWTLTTFNLDFAVDNMEGKTVLVFLKPQRPQRDYRIHAWKVLTGSAGSTEFFDYEAVTETDVTTRGERDNPIISGRRQVAPGQLLQAISPDKCRRFCNRPRPRWPWKS